MDQMTMKRTSSRARKALRDCSGKECATAARNNYFLGKKLTPDSYRTEQLYSIERRHLLNRAVHGWGVVYGFKLSLEDPDGRKGGLTIGEGLALDEQGRELIQAEPNWFSLDNFLFLDENKEVVRQDGDLNEWFKDRKCGEDDCWLLTAHYAEKTIGQVKISDPCRCDREEWDRICETVVYSLKPIACAECCKPWECELNCCCPPKTGCCANRKRRLDDDAEGIRAIKHRYESEIARLENESREKAAELRADLDRELAGYGSVPPKRTARGGCECLCKDSMRLRPRGACGELVDVDDCTFADLVNGVELACLKISQDECKVWSIKSIFDECGRRRLIKGNDLLFDLINGCDLTRIEEIGWAHWHRRTAAVDFDKFVEALGWEEGESKHREYTTRDFWIRFSRPVFADTVTPDCFVFSVMSDQTEGCWLEYSRVPVVDVEYEPGPDGLIEMATLVVSGGWLRDAVVGDGSIFKRGNIRVEIEVRGDFIEDCNGQMVDANARGLIPTPTGNGSPGDNFISTFTVAQWVTTSTSDETAEGGRHKPTKGAAS